jgi:hypothetical protein
MNRFWNEFLYTIAARSQEMHGMPFSCQASLTLHAGHDAVDDVHAL